MKRILLYGATGRTGSLIVHYALQQGYAVTALVRNPSKLAVHSENLTVIRGTPTNAADVRQALRGCDVVISALSALPESQILSFRKIVAPHTLETAMRHTITCMNETGIRRIVTLSSIGASESRPYAPWYMRLMIRLTNFRLVFADHAAQEALLRSSRLDWTIARPVALNNHEHLGKLVVSYNTTPSPFKMSRRQLAQFLVDCVERPDLVHQAPLLSEV
ncbi:NAD(P)-binding oxidoreductase [Hymenobacter sp. YC55]|uniref:NAD(P)-dependent oxidoreductase n=1 Tax=Hymenobacter sp. YC55 TaxID=3034019 RepID=UPI0023F62D34|nr:NAD(P)-binding oxidoreductase [Hymenobacter sp. YC55]MDF7815247.1 SDR family oxidoreductase [Hymenobacter sp. YC55]